MGRRVVRGRRDDGRGQHERHAERDGASGGGAGGGARAGASSAAAGVPWTGPAARARDAGARRVACPCWVARACPGSARTWRASPRRTATLQTRGRYAGTGSPRGTTTRRSDASCSPTPRRSTACAPTPTAITPWPTAPTRPAWPAACQVRAATALTARLARGRPQRGAIVPAVGVAGDVGTDAGAEVYQTLDRLRGRSTSTPSCGASSEGNWTGSTPVSLDGLDTRFRGAVDLLGDPDGLGHMILGLAHIT